MGRLSAQSENKNYWKYSNVNKLSKYSDLAYPGGWVWLHYCFYLLTNMWHDRGEWVKCRLHSSLIYQYKLKMLHFDSKPHHNQTSGCRDMNNSLRFLNNVKHNSLSPLLTYDSISIFATLRLIPLDHVTYIHGFKM